MARRKVGDRVVIKSKYYNPFNDLSGVITDIDDFYEVIIVDLEYHGKQKFNKTELKTGGHTKLEIMENKTAEEILRNTQVDYNNSICKSENNATDLEWEETISDPVFQSLLEAMQAYADQEVSKAIDKALEVASEEAWLTYHDGHFKSNNHGQKQINIGADHVKIDKLSILSLKSEILKELNK